jgi:hypothetical protein
MAGGHENPSLLKAVCFDFCGSKDHGQQKGRI